MPATLVIIDMQEIFRSPQSQWGVPTYDSAAQNVTRLTDRFRGSVVWTRFVRDPEESGSWRQYYDRWSGCRATPESAEWDVTMPIESSDRTLTLPTFSKWGSELAQLSAGSERLVVCGVATECCVLSTVLGAVDAGKHVVVVTDACAGATDEAHDQAMAVMSLLSPMVTLATTDEAIGETAVSGSPSTEPR